MGKFKKWTNSIGFARIPDFIGGAISRGSGTALFVATIVVATGMSPAQLLTFLWETPPTWLLSGWTRLLMVIVGLSVIYGALRANVWTQQQKAINEIAEDISWAIHHLLNEPLKDEKPDTTLLEKEYPIWCKRVSEKLTNRAFFTLADQLHFDRLGFVDQVQMTGQSKHDWLLSQLRLKFERARDIINWVQQRRR